MFGKNRILVIDKQDLQMSKGSVEMLLQELSIMKGIALRHFV